MIFYLDFFIFNIDKVKQLLVIISKKLSIIGKSTIFTLFVYVAMFIHHIYYFSSTFKTEIFTSIIMPMSFFS